MFRNRDADIFKNIKKNKKRRRSSFKRGGILQYRYASLGQMLQLKNRSKGRRAKRESGHYKLQIGKEQTAILVEKSRTATWKARQRERQR